MKRIFVVLTAILLYSCGTSSTIVSSWRDPKITISSENFKKVLVVALVKDEETRRITENRIAASSPIFHTSYQFLNQINNDLTNDQKLKILNDENFDGVVTMRLVSKEKQTDYVPGIDTSIYYGGYNGLYGGAFGGWYGMYATDFYSPGYYVENTFYIVETNVFSLKHNKLIWTGTTQSSDITDIGVTVDDIMRTIINEMKKDGTIPKK
ncbi:hypothetical protein [Flavobacterium hydatis]|jgi:hypothetical protein|uniref:DUF4136 domain-containing protein n=1 Tax=Flavobacterium hydatis TaxID=991 RepID=A0A086AK82_FLAHY|nr:hypothetical protein [Flavobacterium hydatis]KFF17096.1 hypothetical protein IW20_08790 [Flavobacterium hydatis]OXA95644.1 hypothetical protein B0A62_07815 [Flavobacterium hydatis]